MSSSYDYVIVSDHLNMPQLWQLPEEHLTAMGLYQYRDMAGGQPWPLYACKINDSSAKSMAGNAHWRHKHHHSSQQHPGHHQ